jgi:hypothetical protein
MAETIPEPLQLQLFDVVREHLQRSGDWPGPGASCETIVPLLGPAIKNLVCIVEELQG